MSADASVKSSTTNTTADSMVTTTSAEVAELSKRINIEKLKKADYRAFVFVVHPVHGLMLLYCSRKKKKGPHYQLPGGHVDSPEWDLALEQVSQSSTTTTNTTCPKAEVVRLACQMGAARELYEETGLDIRQDLKRLQPANLKNSRSSSSSSSSELTNELAHRLYFVWMVNDNDFRLTTTDTASMSSLSTSTTTSTLVGPMSEPGKEFKLELSSEHQGFIFEPNPLRSAELLMQHSGGYGSKALLMSMQQQQQQQQQPQNK